MTREEELWAAIVAALKNENYAGELPAAPSWRSEEFLMGILAGIKGVSGANVPEPVWNEEKYLSAIFGAVDGGVSKCKLLASDEFTVNTSSTSESSVGTITVDGGWTKDVIIYVKVRDKAGKRSGYFRGSDCFVINNLAANGVTSSSVTPAKFCVSVDANGKFVQISSSYGVYLSAYSKGTGDGVATAVIRAKYNSSYGTINGTYAVEVYALSWPHNDSMYG